MGSGDLPPVRFGLRNWSSARLCRCNSGLRLRRTPQFTLAEVPIEHEAIAAALTQVALDHKAFDAVILDMRSLVDYTDVFVMCSARNRRHVAAIADLLRQHAKKQLEIATLGVEGLPSARWVLLDFGSVVVHVFDEPLRGFYNLDGLWSDAPRLPVPESIAPADVSGVDEDFDEYGASDPGLSPGPQPGEDGDFGPRPSHR